jgi:predicted metal-dependent peptidase
MIKAHNSLIKTVEDMICDPIVNLPYYGEFSLFINFKRSNDISTCGVNITTTMNFYYSEKFLETLSQKNINFVFLHEIFHLLFDHCIRINFRNHKLSNICQDMIINQIISDDINPAFVTAPKNVFFVPKEYEGNLVFEELYDWMKEKQSDYKKDKDSVSDELKSTFDNLEDYEFDVHLDNECDEETKKEIIRDIKERLKQRGFLTSNIEKTLGKLNKPKKDYLKMIKRGISMIKGRTKIKTFKKLNRKVIGLKGNIKQGSMINCIVDTSGSMNGYFDKVFSFLFLDGYVINLIQCDTEVKNETIIKSKLELKKVLIKGLGGTTIMPAINLIKAKYNKYNTLILTDGYTDTLDCSGLKKVLILSTDQQCPVVGKNVKQILIDK